MSKITLYKACLHFGVHVCDGARSEVYVSHYFNFEKILVV